ncbi:MAG: hypothetical protein M1830_008908 [Pleopsidium flavum]|nr:MAG: hypothetical protein M1830_008908 [Pleopsidium flavum]
MYFTGSSGLLAPAPGFGHGLHRSHSATGSRPRRQVIIDTPQWEEHSPIRSSRPRSVHDPHWDDDWDERAYSPGLREHSRTPSRSHSRTRSRIRAHTQGSRDPSPYYWQFENEMKLKELEEFKKKQEEEERTKRIEEQIFLKRAKEEAEEAAQKKEEEEIKKQAIHEYTIRQKEKAEKEKREKEEADKLFKERVKKEFTAAGYSEEHIEAILTKGKKPKAKELSRPTYIKVHRKHLSPETLDVFHLPWEWDDRDTEYILIKQWVPEHDQDALFEHSRKLREGRLLTNTTKELKKERDKLLLVKRKEHRKSSPGRSWMFT